MKYEANLQFGYFVDHWSSAVVILFNVVLFFQWRTASPWMN